MELTTVDGVRALWLEAPGPFVGTLTLRAGRVYEPMAARDVTRLVAQVIAEATYSSPAVATVSTEGANASFAATGSPREVAAYLTEVAHLLTTFPMSRLRRTAERLAAESGDGGPSHTEAPESEWILHHRYGNTGVGRLGAPGAPITAVTEERVRDFLRAHAVADNAILTFTGPVPTGLTLGLPDRPRPERPTPTARPVPRSGVVHGLQVRPTIAFETPNDDVGLFVITGCLERAAAELAARGIGAGTTWTNVMVVRERSLIVLHAEGVAPAAGAAAAETLVRALRSLVSDPPGPDELATQADLCRASLDDETNVLGLLDEVAGVVLTDGVLPEAYATEPDNLDTVTSAEVGERARMVLEDLIVLAPGEGRGPIGGISPVPSPPPHPVPAVTGTTWRARGWSGRRAVFTLGKVGWRWEASGTAYGALWNAVTGVERVGHVRRVHCADGSVLTLEVGALRDPGSALAAFDARTESLAWDAH